MANDGFGRTRHYGRTGGRSKTEPKNVARTLELMPKAAEMRAAGATFRQIGSQLGIDYSWARTLVLRALEEATYEAADVMRVQEGVRLDRLQMGLWPAAVRGDTKAVLAVVRIMERRAKLFGLDAPTRLEVGEAADPDDIDAALTAILGTVVEDDEEG